MDTPGRTSTGDRGVLLRDAGRAEWDDKHKEEHLASSSGSIGMDQRARAYPAILQFLYAPRFPPRTRKLSQSSSNSEGWAHYANRMTVDQGFGGGNPKIGSSQLQGRSS